MRIVRIHQGKTLPLQFRLVIAIILGTLIVLIMIQIRQPYSIVFTIALSTLTPAIWFSANMLEIDLTKNEVFKGIWVMGFRFGDKTSFSSIEKIFIKKTKTKQTIYSLANNKNVVTDHEYRAYIKLDSGHKYFMISHPVKTRIIKKCQQAIRKLGLSEELLVLPD